MGAAGGITSLVSYPALLLAGLSPLNAVVTNTVGLVTLLPGAALGSGPELAGRGRWLMPWALVAAVGGGLGGALLLLTPPGSFVAIVPFLVLAASLALVAQPRIGARRGRRLGPVAPPPRSFGPWLAVTAGYSGYFGGGSGVMTLTLLLLSVESDLVRANALKNVLVGAATVPPAMIFAASGHVRWSAAVPLGIGCFAGSWLGPGLARWIPPRVLRALIALLGVGLAVELWVKP